MHSTLKKEGRTPKPTPGVATPQQVCPSADERRGVGHPAYTGIDSKVYANLLILTLVLDVGSMVVYGVNVFDVLIGCALSAFLATLSGRIHLHRGGFKRTR